MKKVKVSLTETLTYEVEFTLLIPEHDLMPNNIEDRLQDILSEAESKAETASDIPLLVQRVLPGTMTEKQVRADLDNPDSSEVVVDYFEVIEDE